MKTVDAAGLKLINRRVIFDIVRTKRNVTRVELSKMTGMSGPSILAVVNEFIDKGILTVGKKKSGSKGRSPVEMTYNPNVIVSIGIEFEGNDLSVGLVNLDGQILYQITERVSAAFDDNFFRMLCVELDRITQIAEKENIQYMGIGFGIPGVLRQSEKVIDFAPYIGVNEACDISERLKYIEERYHRPVFIENDVNASAMGEYHVRRLQEDISDMLYISIGSGVGAGLILGGKLRRGMHEACGEIGYSILSVKDVISQKGTGWLERKLSYATLCQNFEEYRQTGKVSSCMVEYIESILLPVIVNIVNTLDLNYVVFGGQLILNGGQDLLNSIQDHLAPLVLNEVKLVLEKSAFSGVVGSALVASNAICDSIL